MDHSIGSSGKTFKKTPEQRNSRTGLQKRLTHCSKTLGYCRVSLNSELKGENYGRNGSNGVCFWDGRSGCIHSFDKTNKDLKRKRNSRRGLQGTVIHCFKILSHSGIVLSSGVYGESAFQEGKSPKSINHSRSVFSARIISTGNQAIKSINKLHFSKPSGNILVTYSFINIFY